MDIKYYIILIIVAFLSLQSCKNEQKDVLIFTKEGKICNEEIADIHENLFTVMKIDSLQNFYVIIAKKGSSYYKIVSEKKAKSEDCAEIKICNHLEFNLKSIIDTTKISYKVEGVLFKEVEFEFERDSILDIYESDNLRGLCFQKNINT